MRYRAVSIWFLLVLAILLSLSVPFALAQDSRYCGPPKVDAKGTIQRSTSMVAQFKLVHPCPSTGYRSGSCPGWDIDHVIPLACGGCDQINNMQWLPHAYKITGKDRWERKIYDNGIDGTPSCTNEILK